jgi:hypothetical protein
MYKLSQRSCSTIQWKNYLVYSKTFSCIHEIILLDLSTPAQRVGFFGVHSESIDNIIGKNEAEFS